MRKLLHCIWVLFLCSSFYLNSLAQTTRTVGDGGNYPTLHEAFRDIQYGTLTGDIELLIISDLDETEPSRLYRQNISEWGTDYSSITVRPEGGHRTVSYNNASALFLVDGSTNVTFDGRTGESGDQISLTFINTGGGIFNLVNNVSDFTISYCALKGGISDAENGVISINAWINTDNIVIDNCHIGGEGLISTNAIFAKSETDGLTSNVSVTNNRILNFWNPDHPSAGIYLDENNESWTISGNHLYQTVPLIATTGNMHYGILIGGGNGHVIENNFIGGSEPGCGGDPWTIEGEFASKFTGIHINSGATTPASVQGNTIANFSHQYHSTANAVSLPGIWTGIYLYGGDAFIGNESGNTIGDDTSTGSVTVSSTGSASVATYGIGADVDGKADISNNTIGSFTLEAESVNHGHSFSGIRIPGGDVVTVEGNIVGSENTHASIVASNPGESTSVEQSIRGIFASSNGTISIADNIVANIVNQATGLGKVAGIKSIGGVNSIVKNVVRELSSSTISTSWEYSWFYNSVKGIAIVEASGAQQITGNEIRGLSNMHTGDNDIWASGIFFADNHGDLNTIDRNLVDGISFSNEKGHSLGIIFNNSSETAVMNNAVRLGHGMSVNHFSMGIFSRAGDYHILGNSVYITGIIDDSRYKSYSYLKYTGNDIVKNNIFSNERTIAGEDQGVQVSIGIRSDAVIDSDFNNLYTGGRTGVAYRGDFILELFPLNTIGFEDWQTSYDQDLNSFSVDPLFAGADEEVPDLHITEASPMIDAGTPHPLLITDIDGDLRGEVPDIGCDEYYTSSFIVDDEFTLKQAFDKINSGELTGQVSIVLTSGTTETETAVLYPSGYDGAGGVSDYTSVSVGAADQSITVAGNFAGPLVRLDGVHDVNIGNITFENEHTEGYCIEFANSANNNRVANSILKSSVQVAGTGVITFGGAGAGNGNDNNIIEYCEILNTGGTTPIAGIVSAGTEGSENSGNTISNNNILNFWSDTYSSAGIYIDENNSAWTITDNNIYQEEPIAAGGGNSHYGINLASTEGHTVSGNYIGGSASGCEGLAWTVTSSYPNVFTGIHIEGENTGESTISDNTISNFNWQSAPDQDIWEVPGVFNGIRYEGGAITISDNTIGSDTGNNSIEVETTSEFHAVSFGIAGGIEGAGITISDNTIGSINVSSGNTDFSHSFVGIQNYEAGTLEISGNLIGSTETPGSITTSTECTSEVIGQYVAGIVNGGSSPTALIKDNTIINLVNLTLGADGSGQPHKIAGIVIDSGSSQIIQNTISNLSTSSRSVAEDWGESATGILMMSEDPGQEITGNTIFNISNTSAEAGHYVSGIAYKGPVTGVNIVNANRIYGLTVSSSAGSVIRGISIYGGEVTCFNNMVSLGSAIGGGNEIYGIYKNTGDKGEFYHNSIVVSGPASVTSGLNTAAFMHDQSATGDVLKNNILFNNRNVTDGTGKNYAFYRSNTGPITIDYNNYLASGVGGVLGYDGEGDRTSLPLVNGQDDNSISEEVGFDDLANAGLYIVEGKEKINGKALPVDGITVDFEGQERNPIYPDIGADEFILSVITVDPTLLEFPDTYVRETSDPQFYKLSAIDLQAGLDVTAPLNFEISLSSEEGFGKSLSISPVNTNVETTTVYVRFAPVDRGDITEEVENISTGAITKLVGVRGEAIAVAPLVSTSPASDITPDSATGNGTIVQTGGINADTRGIIWWPYTGNDKEITDEGVTNLQEEGSFEADDFDQEITGLDINTRYNYRAHASNPEGVGYGETVYFRTHAVVPGAPEVDEITGMTVDITLADDDNPVHTVYAIHETTRNRYVQEDGTMGLTPFWQTGTEWGTKTVELEHLGNRTGNQNYSYRVKARNEAGVETEYSETTDFLSLANTPNIMSVRNETQTTVIIGVFTYSSDYSNNSASTLYAVTEHNSELFVQSDGTLGSEAAWKTRDDWYNFTVTGLSIGTEYSFSSIARNDDGIETEPGPERTTFTLAAVPGAPVVDNITETTAEIEIDPGDNPANVEMTIRATREGQNRNVQADGTIGFEIVWQTAADWDGTVITELVPNENLSFTVKARNGNNVDTEYGEVTEITTLANTPDRPNINHIEADRIGFTVNATGNSTSTEFTVQDSISGNYVQSDGYLGADPVWKTRSEWMSAAEYILGLTSSTWYGIRVRARNDIGTETEWGLSAVRATLALMPGTPTVENVTTESVDVRIDPNDNPDNVTFAIRGPNSKYVQADGSLGDTEVWRSVADWGVVTVTGLDPNEEVMFWVKARNEDGVETNFSSSSSEIWTLAKTPVAPSVEVISSSTIHITIQDDGNPASVSYKIHETTTGRYLGYNGQFSDHPVWWLPNRDYFELRYLVPDTEYTFRLIARNSNHVETEPGPAASGTTPPAPPAAPALVEPANYATDQDTSLTLSWNEVEKVDSYGLQVSSSWSFEEEYLVFDERGLLNTSVLVEGLNYGYTYYWRVNATNAEGEGDWSESWSFTTKAGPPATPELIAPENGAENVQLTMHLNWADAHGAQTYAVQVSEEEDFSTMLIDDDMVSGVWYELSDLDGLTTYYWRVKASNSYGESSWSEVWSFTTTVGVPEAPLLGYPADNATNVPLDVAFSWHPSEHAQNYDIRVGFDSDMSGFYYWDDNIQDTTYSISGMTGDRTYYWWVRARNNSGTGEWSEIWSFTTEDPTGITIPGEDSSKVSIFPNPVTDILYISGVETFPVRAVIISEGGQVVIDQMIDKHEINVQHLVPGVYFIRVEAAGVNYTIGFVKQ